MTEADEDAVAQGVLDKATDKIVLVEGGSIGNIIVGSKSVTDIEVESDRVKIHFGAGLSARHVLTVRAKSGFEVEASIQKTRNEQQPGKVT